MSSVSRRATQTLLYAILIGAVTVASAQQSDQRANSKSMDLIESTPVRANIAQKPRRIAEVVAQKTAIRKARNQSSSVMLYVSKGTYLLVLGSKQGYDTVSLGNGSQGYVLESDVRLTTYEAYFIPGVQPNRTGKRTQPKHPNRSQH